MSVGLIYSSARRPVALTVLSAQTRVGLDPVPGLQRRPNPARILVEPPSKFHRYIGHNRLLPAGVSRIRACKPTAAVSWPWFAGRMRWRAQAIEKAALFLRPARACPAHRRLNRLLARRGW